MLIQKTRIESRVFNLDDDTDSDSYNQLLDDPSVRVLEKRWITHKESTQEGRSKVEITENHVYLEWEKCSL